MLLRGKKCELCGVNDASDLHEIFCRSMTIGNEEARNTSYEKELCSLLCRECHSKADSYGNRLILLDKNIERYGYERVHSVYNRMQSAMRIHIPFDFPEE